MLKVLFGNLAYWISPIMLLKTGIDFLVAWFIFWLVFVAMKNRVSDKVFDSANKWIFGILMVLVGVVGLIVVGINLGWLAVGGVVGLIVVVIVGAVMFMELRPKP